MPAPLILVLFAVLTCIAFLVEAWHYRRRLHRIPIRIHVNGTRGKSSVTRLICAGLNAGGIRTCGKTTGTLARMIFSDGSEVPIFRPCRANVIEQKRVVRAAVADAAEALVIECMALQPLLQSVCELKLVQSTVGVITNARADHLDVMGPSRLDVASALSGTTPVAGTLFTAEACEDSLQVLQAAAKDRGTSFEPISQFEKHRVTPKMLSGFSYLEHPDNVALALRVCELFHVDRDSALKGMWAATPDPGAMRVYRFPVETRDWYFLNAFAANDPESTGSIWDSAYDRFPEVQRRIALMNCRSDRPDRSVMMAKACAQWRTADQYIVTGTGTERFTRTLIAAGIASHQIQSLGEVSGAEIVASMSLQSIEATMIMGMGNIAGPGMSLIDHFEDTARRARSNTPASEESESSSRTLTTSQPSLKAA